MNEFTVILITALYFMLGIGVSNMWRVIINDKWPLFIVVMWPLFLIIASILPAPLKLNND